MSGVNKVILLGNLGKDPEIKNFESGRKVATFPLATNRSYRTQDGKRVEETEWHNIELWGNLADLAEKYLNKGSQVFIEGRIRTRSWDDKEGNKRYITEIVGDNMTFVGGRGQDDDKGTDRATNKEQPKADEVPADETDDLPF